MQDCCCWARCPEAVRNLLTGSCSGQLNILAGGMYDMFRRPAPGSVVPELFQPIVDT